MGERTYAPSRAALLGERGKEAATFAWICAFVGIPAWLWCVLSYGSTDPGEPVSALTLLAGVVGVIATVLFAAAAGSSFVLGALADAERASAADR